VAITKDCPTAIADGRQVMAMDTDTLSKLEKPLKKYDFQRN
jgi:hypothetical protein